MMLCRSIGGRIQQDVYYSLSRKTISNLWIFCNSCFNRKYGGLEFRHKYEIVISTIFMTEWEEVIYNFFFYFYELTQIRFWKTILDELLMSFDNFYCFLGELREFLLHSEMIVHFREKICKSSEVFFIVKNKIK
jgi:hypothetical protein